MKGILISFTQSVFNINRKLIMRALAVLIIIIAIIVLMVCFKGKKHVNSFANSNNKGIAAQDGKWIYFVDFDDDEPAGIKKIKQNGKKAEKVVDGSMAYLNISNGYIYCIEYDENESQSNLIKMKLNGKKKETLARDINLAPINVADKWVYYYKNSSLYRVKISGEDREKVSDKNIVYYQIEGKWIYYIYSKDSSCYIAKMKLNGEDNERLAKSDSLFEAIYVDGGKLYYIEAKANKKYDYDYNLFVMNTKGEKAEKICKIDTNIQEINMQKDRIYYTVTEDYDEYEIKSIKYNGEDKTTIKKVEELESINVTGKWITFLDEADDYTIRMISVDGKKEKNL